jgi:hypothetical protein
MDKLLELLPSIFIPDEAMLLISLLLFAVFVWHGKTRENYVVGAMAVAMLFRIAYFAIQALNIEQFQAGPLRTALTRPSEAVLSFLLIIFFINGRVNKFIRHMLTGQG